MGDQLLGRLPATAARERTPIYLKYLPPGFVIAHKSPKARPSWRCEHCGAYVTPRRPLVTTQGTQIHGNAVREHADTLGHIAALQRNERARRKGQVALRDVLDHAQLTTLGLLLGPAARGSREDGIADDLYAHVLPPQNADQLEDLVERVRDASAAPAEPSNAYRATVLALAIVVRLRRGARALRLVHAQSLAWHLAMEAAR
jgi:hypothetical protein